TWRYASNARAAASSAPSTCTADASSKRATAPAAVKLPSVPSTASPAMRFFPVSMPRLRPFEEMRVRHIDRRLVLTLAVLEPVEVRWPCGTREILTGHSDERAGEIRESRRGRFVRENACIELLRHPLP